MTFAWAARKKREMIKQRDLIAAADGSAGLGVWGGRALVKAAVSSPKDR